MGRGLKSSTTSKKNKKKLKKGIDKSQKLWYNLIKIKKERGNQNVKT